MSTTQAQEIANKLLDALPKNLFSGQRDHSRLPGEEPSQVGNTCMVVEIAKAGELMRLFGEANDFPAIRKSPSFQNGFSFLIENDQELEAARTVLKKLADQMRVSRSMYAFGIIIAIWPIGETERFEKISQRPAPSENISLLPREDLNAGDRLWAMRKSRSLTIQALASMTGIEESRLREKEQGEEDLLSGSEWEALEEVLGDESSWVKG